MGMQETEVSVADKKLDKQGKIKWGQLNVQGCRCGGVDVSSQLYISRS